MPDLVPYETAEISVSCFCQRAAGGEEDEVLEGGATFFQLFSCSAQAFADVAIGLKQSYDGMASLCRQLDDQEGGDFFASLFRAIDVDGSGTITRKEMKGAMGQLGMDTSKVDKMFELFVS